MNIVKCSQILPVIENKNFASLNPASKNSQVQSVRSRTKNGEKQTEIRKPFQPKYCSSLKVEGTISKKDKMPDKTHHGIISPQYPIKITLDKAFEGNDTISLRVIKLFEVTFQ
jgi:hypothetical protein